MMRIMRKKTKKIIAAALIAVIMLAVAAALVLALAPTKAYAEVRGWSATSAEGQSAAD